MPQTWPSRGALVQRYVALNRGTTVKVDRWTAKVVSRYGATAVLRPWTGSGVRCQCQL